MFFERKKIKMCLYHHIFKNRRACLRRVVPLNIWYVPLKAIRKMRRGDKDIRIKRARGPSLGASHTGSS